MKSKGQRYLAGSEIFSSKDSYHYNKSKHFMKNESISRLRGRITSMRLLSNQLSSALDSMQNIDYGEKILIKYSETEWFSGNIFNIDDDEYMTGYGTYHYKNGDEYEGFISNGMRNGIGEYRYNNKNSEYIGQWKNDKRNGNGSLKIANYEYDGEWIMNNPNNCFVFKIVESNESYIEKSNKNNADFINFISNKESNEVIDNLKKLNETNNNGTIELIAYIKNGRLIHYVMCETDLHNFLNLNKDLNISHNISNDDFNQIDEVSLDKNKILTDNKVIISSSGNYLDKNESKDYESDDNNNSKLFNANKHKNTNISNIEDVGN